MTKRPSHLRLILVLLGLAAFGYWWSVASGARGEGGTAAASRTEVPARRSGPLVPLPQAPPAAVPALVELGRRLFHDVRLSRDNTVSCASCHVIGDGGGDRRPTAVGVAGRVGEANTPTVLNAAFNFRQFWDGRAATLEEQAAGPIHNPIEMDSSWEQVLGKLAEDPEYRRLAREATGEPLGAGLMTRAIAAFERTLITPDAPFDRYLRGDKGALSDAARRGHRLFLEYGCVACHQGVNVGGNLFANLGVMGDFFAGRPPKKIDQGRFNVTANEEDRHKFKVPSLRNVELTAPYFHDGSVPTLENAVEIMARYQLGVDVARADRDAIVAFLKSLTGRPVRGQR